MDLIDFYSILFPTVEVNGVHQLATDILKISYFVFSSIYTGLKQLEGE